MGHTRYASVLGLGFGDCGKGLFIDALTRRWGAHTVVRFNGGAQAGHNVVERLPEGSVRHHTFSQFGAGTLVPGVRTVLAYPVVVHPTALLMEAKALAKIGIHSALERLLIDRECLVTTPFHQAAGRLREHLRAADAHGSCGVGVGETVGHALSYADEALRYGELLTVTVAEKTALLNKLEGIRRRFATELLPSLAQARPDWVDYEVAVLSRDGIAERWLEQIAVITEQCIGHSADAIANVLSSPGCVLFEGAQGVLLDEWRGFHPHTTWSTINTKAIDTVAHHYGITSCIEHLGVMRSYLTRHGAGPLPTHDALLNDLSEPHNTGDSWQGAFRRGHPDAVLLRYALSAIGDLSGLLVSHMDVFDRVQSLRWCESYLCKDIDKFLVSNITTLPLSERGDLSHQSRLTKLLRSAQPLYAESPIRTSAELIERIACETSLPIRFTSSGNTHRNVFES